MKNITVPHGYVRVDDLKTIQHLLLELFKEYHEICEVNGLVYNAFGGTMLGAVRHKGFIPWDNDIDVTMPRPDYEKFIRLVNDKYSSHFKALAYPDKGCLYPYAKFILRDSIWIENALRLPDKFPIGLYIDVFPADGYPEQNPEQFFKCYSTLEKMRVYKNLKFTVPSGWKRYFIFVKCIIAMICRAFPTHFYLKREISISKKNDFKSAHNLLLMGNGWYQKGKIKKDVYLNRKLYDFEDMKIWGINDYDEHLKRLYGDYMSLPPVEDRVPNHDSQFYIKSEVLDQMVGRKSR